MILKEYVDQERGRAANLGKKLGITPTLISQWANGVRVVPAERCPEIEKATSGTVRCEELRPDIDWSYLRGTQPVVANLSNFNQISNIQAKPLKVRRSYERED